MKLAIMQPYFLPYIGYFQLFHAVDKFIFLDDVNFIKKGWINRNRILINNEPTYFTLPLKSLSQNKQINELYRYRDAKWEKKFLNTLYHSYSKAPFFKNVFNLMEAIIHHEEDNLSQFLTGSLQTLNKYLGITTTVKRSSENYRNQHLKGAERLIDICLHEAADEYINPPGGKSLYDKEEFKENGIHIFFLEPGNIQYNQYKNHFIPGLSILDVMMFNNPQEIRKMLKIYTLV
jgi:hypothetical protein